MREIQKEVLEKLTTEFACRPYIEYLNWEIEYAAVAQLEEQWFCKPQVVGSTPTSGSE